MTKEVPHLGVTQRAAAPPTGQAGQAAVPHGSDQESRRRATELCLQLKKTLDAQRLYQTGQNAEPFRADLYVKVSGYVAAFGDLALELSGTTIEVDGKVVYTSHSEKAVDSITYPLVAEGVQEVVFSSGLVQPE